MAIIYKITIQFNALWPADTLKRLISVLFVFGHNYKVNDYRIPKKACKIQIYSAEIYFEAN